MLSWTGFVEANKLWYLMLVKLSLSDSSYQMELKENDQQRDPTVLLIMNDKEKGYCKTVMKLLILNHHKKPKTWPKKERRR